MKKVRLLLTAVVVSLGLGLSGCSSITAPDCADVEACEHSPGSANLHSPGSAN